ncbi:MAG: tyrosine-type recombinase/integrase [Thermoanaerobaculia bacterium]|jgi:integrase
MITKRPVSVKFGDYTLSPKRTRTTAAGSEWYWWLRLRKNGQEGQWAVGWHKTPDTAKAAAMKLLVELQMPRRPSVGGSAPLTACLEAYCEAVEGMSHLRASTRRGRKYAARIWRDFLAETAADLTCAALTVDHLRAFQQWLDHDGYERTTQRLILMNARVVIRWAVEAWAVPNLRVPTIDVPPTRKRVPTNTEVERVLAVADSELGAMLRIARYTGLRFGEIASRSWDDVDLAEGVIAIADRGDWKPKTKDSYRTVAIDEVCVKALWALSPQPGKPVFGSTCRHLHRDYGDRLKAACIDAGVQDFTWHALRRFVSDGLRRAQVGIKVYQIAMGHSVQTALREYQQPTPEEIRDAFAAGQRANGAVNEGDRRSRRPSSGHSGGPKSGYTAPKFTLKRTPSTSSIRFGWRPSGSLPDESDG